MPIDSQRRIEGDDDVYDDNHEEKQPSENNQKCLRPGQVNLERVGQQIEKECVQLSVNIAQRAGQKTDEYVVRQSTSHRGQGKRQMSMSCASQHRTEGRAKDR